MGIPADEYTFYKKQIQDIYYHGTKEDLIALYNRIIAAYGYCDDLYDLDHYQGSWRVLPPR